MTTAPRSPSNQPGPPGRSSRRVRVALLAILIAALVVAVLVTWYFFFRPAGPPPIGPGAPIIPGVWIVP